MRYLLFWFCAFLVAAQPAAAQTGPDEEAPPVMDSAVAATPAEARLRGFAQRQRLFGSSLVANVPFDNIGPTVMSGRVVDVDVNPADPTHLYVAYASGGLWETTNNGLSFAPRFDDQAVMTLGDIAVDWAHGGTIWAGTGENNSSRSSYAGTGVYRSDDGGATWQHRGLAETHRTGRILIHPDDPNTVWVAALGALYASSPHRGVYRTTDGGETWTQTLFVDDDTGVVDLVLDPSNPDVLYAASWHRERRAWNFVEGGEGSGIWKSEDGGRTWTRLTTEGSGFPAGPHVGRIGLAIHPSGVLYALLDNQARRPDDDEEDEDAPVLTRDALRTMSKEQVLAVAEEDLEAYLRENGFPAAYTAQSVLEMIRNDEIAPVALVEYLEDANQQLFDTPVIGPEVYRSDDGGATWTRTHDDFIDGLYYSYGYYFGEIRVAPDDARRIYIMGVPILKSEDGGQTFASINEPNVHVDHHALWVSPSRPGHLVNGNDGGLNISYDDGATWYKANTPSVGQFYAVQVDDADPYHVYGGLQDNGVWDGPHTYRHSVGWHGSGDYPYDRLLGGDGMQVEIDTRSNDVVYTGFQFGNYFRIEKGTGVRSAIKPSHELGERPLRFNWQSPIHLSRHNQDILYFGSNKVHRSFDRGETWETLSDDLTQGGRPGDVPYGTLTSLDESPLRFGVLYAGSDDGLVHVTRDAGASWQRISDGLPQDLWVSRVEASHHDPARVYVALNGYRWDHFDAYVYRSDDYGQSWTRLGTDLPAEPVNVVLEDPHNPDLLFVGTDHALYASLD
ncbi:MAG: glycosyl hydrolase, partial [Rhodothermales bacterium]|nr:glycosyl hydrolase [Rhodothermales bacterium]